MGYLAVLAGTFVASLVTVAVVLAVLSVGLNGEVHSGVLPASLIIAFLAAKTTADRYERGW
jgi:hypothetical protein